MTAKGPLSHGLRRASSPAGGAKWTPEQTRLPLWGRCPVDTPDGEGRRNASSVSWAGASSVRERELEQGEQL